jgi:hypothetical protein
MCNKEHSKTQPHALDACAIHTMAVARMLTSKSNAEHDQIKVK